LISRSVLRAGLGLLAALSLWPAAGCFKRRTHGLEPPARADCVKVAGLLEQHTRREATSYAELRPGQPGQHAAAADLVSRLKDHYVGLCMRHTAPAVGCMVESQNLSELFGCQKQIVLGAPPVEGAELPVAEARQVLQALVDAAQAPVGERTSRLVKACEQHPACASAPAGARPAAGEPEHVRVWARWEHAGGRARAQLSASQRAALDRAMYNLDRSAGAPVEYQALEGRPRPFVYRVVVPAWAAGLSAAPSAPSAPPATP
jgi:hypothetical protein